MNQNRKPSKCFTSIRILLTLIPFYIVCSSQAQNDDSITVKDIKVIGNAKTQEPIILRELLLKKDVVISRESLPQLIDISRNNLIKTSLFHTVNIDTVINNDSLLLHIQVVERWYLWAWPLVEHPDRNINVWLKKGDLSRLSTGIHVQHENFRGRLERFNVKVLLGYRKMVALTYDFPYLNKSKTLGLSVNTMLSRQREVNYTTTNNIQQYYQGDHEMLGETTIAIIARYRPRLHLTQFLTLQLSNFTINDSLFILNSDYLLPSADQTYLGIKYSLKVDYRDNRTYPLEGIYGESELSYLKNTNSSFNQSGWRTSLRGYLPLSTRLYVASELAIKLTNPEKKPYYFQNALGYNRDFVRGYEYTVIEGPHYWLAKSHLKFALLPHFLLRMPYIKSTKFNSIPISIYVGPHFDAGKVWPAMDPSVNSLQGSLLAGYGFGVDLVTYYDKVLRIEYTLRQKGPSGLFFHFMATI